MTRLHFGVGRCLVVVLALLIWTASTNAQAFKWWQDATFKRELGLTNEQVSRLEEIFQKSLPALRQQKAAWDVAQGEFDRLVEKADDASVMQQVTNVEAARAELNKTRTVMLLRMRRTLTSDQWAKFTKLHAEHADRRDRQGHLK